MAVKSPGDYLLEDGKEDGMARTVPCLDTKQLDEGCYKEDNFTAMSEQHGPSPIVDDCGVSSEGKCGPKYLETSASQSEDEADGGACGEENNLTAMSEQHGPSPIVDDCGVSSEGKCGPKYLETSASQSEDEADGGACGEENSPSPVLTIYPGQPGFTLKKAEDGNLYSALPSTDFLQPSIVPKTLPDETPQPLSISTKQQEPAQDFLSTPENPYKNSVIGERARHDRYSDKFLPDPKEYSPVDILTKSKNADDGKKIREHGTNAGAIGNPVKDAQERKVSVSSRGKAEEVLDTRSETSKWFFEDDKEFQNWEPSCPDGDSRLFGQVRNKHRPTYEHYYFSIPERGYPIFRFGKSKKKYFNFDTFLNTKLEEEALACTEAKSHTEYDEGFDDKLYRTSKALIKYSEGGLASNITKHTINESSQLLVGETQLQQKQENKLSGSRLFSYCNAGESLESEDEEECLRHYQNTEEDEYLRLHQRKEKPSTKSGSQNTIREKSSCVRQIEKEDASFQSDAIAPQHICPSTDHCDYDAEPEEYLQNKTLEQGHPVTPGPVVIGKSESASGSDFGIEYPRQSDRDAEVLSAPEEKNKYTNERNRDKSCKENRDTFYIPWPNQTLAEFLHQNQLNARDEELANATYTTAGARNASEVPAILFPGGTNRDGRTLSPPLISVKVTDGSAKTFLCRDASLEIQPAPRNDSSDLQKNPDDDIVGFTDDDDYTAAQTNATTPDMNAHSVLPDNPTPALNEKEDSGPAEHGKAFVSIEGVETPSTSRSFESDMSNVDQDQHQGVNEDTSEKEHSAINNMVVYVERTAHVSEHDLETGYNHDKSEHVSDCHQERKHQDNPAGFVLDAEVKEKSAEVLTAEGDTPECDKQYAMIYPRLYEFGDNSSADFQEENDKNRTHGMPASFGATSVPSNKSAPAPRGIHLNNRNYQNRPDNYLESKDDREGLPAGRHGMLRHQRSPSSRTSTDVTDTSNSKSTVSDENVSCSDSDVTETEVFSCQQTGKATHCRKAGQHQQEFMPCSDRCDAAHKTPTKSEIIPTQNECLFEPDGNVQKAHTNKSKLQLSTSPKEISLHDHGDQQSSDAETTERCDYKRPVPVDFSNKPLIVLKGKKQYSESAVINRRSWQVDDTETTNEYRSLGPENPSGFDTCFPDHHFLIKLNIKEIDIHSNSDQESQSRSDESLDPKLRTKNEIVQERFGPEEQFDYDEQPFAKKKHFESFEEKLLLRHEARLSTVEVPRDKCGVDHILGSCPMSYLRPSPIDIVVCPAKRDNSRYPPDPASDDENSDGPQDEDDLVEDGPQNENQLAPPGIPASTRPPDHRGIAGRENAHRRVFAGEDHIGHGAQNESLLPRHGDSNASLGQSDREATAGIEVEPRRAVICLDLFEPGARGEHQPPRVGIPCPFLRQTDRQGTAGREGEPGGAVICVDPVERGARGERRLPNRGIIYTAHPCRCPQCLLVHLRANIGLPAVAVPCPTECRGDSARQNDVHAGLTSQVSVSPFQQQRDTAAERSSRPCDVSRLSQAARRILFPGSTCNGRRTQENSACLDCLGFHFRQNANIGVEQQPCSHENSSTQSTVEEVDIAVHDGGRFQHCFDALGHRLCVMCERHAVNTRLHNCLHQVVCRHCARFVRVCPRCGEPVVCFFVF